MKIPVLTFPVLTFLGAAAAFGTAAYGDTVTVTGGSAFYYENSGPVDTITLDEGTYLITDLSASGVVSDQGWGGTGLSNAYLSLDVNGVSIWGDTVAVANHDADPSGTSFNVDINAGSDPTAYANLNTALEGIDWSSTPTVTAELDASAPGYPGWSVSVNGADLSVTSSVPENTSTLALLAASLIGIALLALSSRLRGLLGLNLA